MKTSPKEILFRLRLGEKVELPFPPTKLIAAGLNTAKQKLSCSKFNKATVTDSKIVISEDVAFSWGGREFSRGSSISSKRDVEQGE